MNEPPSKKRRLSPSSSPSLAELREASASRLLTTWTSIEAKYCHNGPNALSIEDDDLIDIINGDVVEDRGILRGLTRGRTVGGEEESESEGESEATDAEELRSVIAREKARLAQTSPQVTPPTQEESDDELDLLPRISPKKPVQRAPSVSASKQSVEVLVSRRRPSVNNPRTLSTPPPAFDSDSDSSFDFLPSKSVKTPSLHTPSPRKPTTSPLPTPSPIKRTEKPSSPVKLATKAPVTASPKKSATKATSPVKPAARAPATNSPMKLSTKPAPSPRRPTAKSVPSPVKLPEKATPSPMKLTTKPLPAPSPSYTSATPPVVLKPCLKSPGKKRKRVDSDSESYTEFTVPVHYPSDSEDTTSMHPIPKNPRAMSHVTSTRNHSSTPSSQFPLPKRCPANNHSSFAHSPPSSPPPIPPASSPPNSSPLRSPVRPVPRRTLSSAPSSPSSRRKASSNQGLVHARGRSSTRPLPSRLRSPSPTPTPQRSKSLSRIDASSHTVEESAPSYARAPTLPPHEAQIQAHKLFGEFMTRMMGLLAPQPDLPPPREDYDSRNEPHYSSHNTQPHYGGTSRFGDDLDGDDWLPPAPPPRSTPPRRRRRVSFKIDEEEHDGEDVYDNGNGFPTHTRTSSFDPRAGWQNQERHRHEQHTARNHTPRRSVALEQSQEVTMYPSPSYQSPFDFSGFPARANTPGPSSNSSLYHPTPDPFDSYPMDHNQGSSSRRQLVYDTPEPGPSRLPSSSTFRHTPVPLPPSRIPRRVSSASHLPGRSRSRGRDF